MRTLFISYKRDTIAVAPLMECLHNAHYRLWFDRSGGEGESAYYPYSEV